MTRQESAIRDALELPSDQDASGRSLGAEEIELLTAVVHSGVLTSTKGSLVRRLEREFAELLGVRFVCACASGTAAIHAAVAAVDPEPGDEVVTTPITDMGALTPILYQGAIPVFCDVEPRNLNITASRVAPRLSPRTRAIIVTHLFGHPCQMDELVDLAEARGIPLIEDCAQAFLARYGGRPVGTIGQIACFSLQQGKHMTTGEGGLVATDDESYAKRIRLFVNKGWDYGGPDPDHGFLALNYRMSELQGAVGLAQLRKLEANVVHRILRADRLAARLSGQRGIELPLVSAGCEPTYWRYHLMVDSDQVPGGTRGLAARLGRRGVLAAPNYIRKPAFECGVFSNQVTFGNSRFPFTLARPEATDYAAGQYPGVYEALGKVLVLPWNERLTEAHVDHIGQAIIGAAASGPEDDSA